MAQPFKFRYANEISGCFVLILLLLFVFALLFAGKVQGWLTPNRSVKIEIPEAGSEGLREGAEVECLGTRIGSVYAIAPNENGNLVATLKVRDDYFKQYLREDSKATLTKKLAGIGGDTLVKITRGTGAQLPERGATLTVEAEKASGFNALAEDLQGGVERIITEVELVLREVQGLIADIRSPNGEVQTMLRNANDLLYAAHTGGGPIGMALYDTNLVNRIHSTVRDVNDSVVYINRILYNVDGMISQSTGLVAGVGQQLETILGQTSGLMTQTSGIMDSTDEALRKVPGLVDQVSGVVGDVKQTTEGVPALVDQVSGVVTDVRGTTTQVPDIVADVGQMVARLKETVRSVDNIIKTVDGESGEIPELVAQAKDTLRETEKLIKGIERHWLIRKYIEENPGAREGPISPGELQSFDGPPVAPGGSVTPPDLRGFQPTPLPRRPRDGTIRDLQGFRR